MLEVGLCLDKIEKKRMELTHKSHGWKKSYQNSKGQNTKWKMEYRSIQMQMVRWLRGDILNRQFA